ncbi:MAG TPA: site-specific DNA-methyltransferase [Solirubrobacteraceae bacterium]|jgi:hypothetical protein|nr:site-specific DNA-methyltransferase [Solirubrobacteraceae bacterium]
MKRATKLDTGVLYCEDNLRALARVPDGSVDLIYLDPPFFSNRFYEVIWGDEAEVRSFEDRWEGGIQVYVNWMQERLVDLHRVLKQTGSLYLHCDWHASHYLKVMMDDIFGSANFANEIVWRRTGAHNKVGRYGPVHDTILFYKKSSDAVWTNPRRPYMRSHVEKYFVQDERGWRTNYYGNVLTGSGRRGGARCAQAVRVPELGYSEPPRTPRHSQVWGHGCRRLHVLQPRPGTGKALEGG